MATTTDLAAPKSAAFSHAVTTLVDATIPTRTITAAAASTDAIAAAAATHVISATATNALHGRRHVL
jgi:hypothetical protein